MPVVAFREPPVTLLPVAAAVPVVAWEEVGAGDAGASPKADIPSSGNSALFSIMFSLLQAEPAVLLTAISGFELAAWIATDRL